MLDSTIARIDTTPFRIPLTEKVAFGTGVLTHAEHVLVQIIDSDGAVGTAEAIPRPMIHGETIGSVMAVYEEELRPRLLGRRLGDRTRLLHELELVVGNHTAKGALDLALFDLICRRLDVSCHRLLGGFANDVAVTGMLAYGLPEQLADEACEMNERYGINSFKIKVGMDVKKDVAAVHAVRDRLGSALINVDANHAFSILDALRFGRMVSELDLAWIEEPCPAERVVERARLAGSGLVNILGDESCTTPAEVTDEILGGRAHMVSMKIARTGYLQSDEIRGFCESAGAPIVIGSQGDSKIGTLTSVAYGAAHPSTCRHPGEYAYFLKLEDDLLAGDLEIVNGRLAAPDVPGNGVEIDGDKLAHYRIRDDR